MRPRPERQAPAWVLQSLQSEFDTSGRVLLWLVDDELRREAADGLRTAGLEVVEASEPSATLLGQHFALAVIELSVPGAERMADTMRRACFTDQVLLVSSEETTRGEVISVRGPADVVHASLLLGPLARPSGPSGPADARF